MPAGEVELHSSVIQMFNAHHEDLKNNDPENFGSSSSKSNTIMTSIIENENEFDINVSRGSIKTRIHHKKQESLPPQSESKIGEASIGGTRQLYGGQRSTFSFGASLRKPAVHRHSVLKPGLKNDLKNEPIDFKVTGQARATFHPYENINDGKSRQANYSSEELKGSRRKSSQDINFQQKQAELSKVRRKPLARTMTLKKF